MVLAAAGGTCAAAALMAYAVRGRSSRAFGPSVFRGDPGRRSLALTFDDGPSESTPAILRILEQHGVRATFFQCGMHADRLPDVAREVAAAGHEIGNHTWSHARLWLRSAKSVEREVERAQETIVKATGVAPRLFRAPYGVRWFGLRDVQQRLGLLGVMWTVLARDWRLPAAGILNRLTAGASNGAIFCLHDGRGAAVRPDVSVTIEALRRLLPPLSERGWQFETVSEILWPTT